MKVTLFQLCKKWMNIFAWLLVPLVSKDNVNFWLIESKVILPYTTILAEILNNMTLVITLLSLISKQALISEQGEIL